PTTPGCLKPTRTALLWTRHTTRTSPCFSSSFAPRTWQGLHRSQPDSGQRESDKLEPEGVQVLLHPSPAKRHCGHCRRADGASTPAATGAIGCGCALHSED